MDIQIHITPAEARLHEWIDRFREIDRPVDEIEADELDELDEDLSEEDDQVLRWCAQQVAIVNNSSIRRFLERMDQTDES